MLAGLLAASVACLTDAHAACTVTQRTTVPLERAGTLLIVPLMLNEQPARFLLDTGAERTVVTTDAARRFDLARDEWVATTMRAANGALERNRNANPHSISLGGVALRRRSIARDNSLVVTTPTALPGTNIDGLLGRDFLVSFDLSLDLPAGTLQLYEVSGCAGRFLPWSKPYFGLPGIDHGADMPGERVGRGSPISGDELPGSLPARGPTGSALMLRAEIDGVPLRALLDTGASHSLIAAPGIHRLGLTPDLTDTQARIGMSAAARSLEGRLRRIDVLRVGPDVQRSVPMLIAPVRVVPTADMILGADWLGGRSVWLSFSTDQVFVTARD